MDQAELDFTLRRPPEPPPPRSRASQILDAFCRFNAANPHIWKLFDRFALEAVSGGRARYSADAILHRIRWHLDIETMSADGLKINDHYSAYYARLFQCAHPELRDFFSTRVLKSSAMGAHAHDVQAFVGGPHGDETEITVKLGELVKLELEGV